MHSPLLAVTIALKLPAGELQFMADEAPFAGKKVPTPASDVAQA
jgi:hypothetical protein